MKPLSRSLYIRAAIATDAQTPLKLLLNTGSLNRFRDALSFKARTRFDRFEHLHSVGRHDHLSREVAQLSVLRARYLTPMCTQWPRHIRRAGLLRVRGQLAVGRSCAIIGTRTCSAEGLHRTRELSRLLSANGYTIVSGGAFGVDITALRTAHDMHTPTVTVLGSGLLHASPRMHRDFFEQSIAKGAVLSSFESNQRPAKWTFPKRNLWIAELAQMCVVIEGRVRSGALMAARHALALGKPVFTLESFRNEQHLSANRILLDEGAQPLSALVMNSVNQKGYCMGDFGLDTHARSILGALSFGGLMPQQLTSDLNLHYTKIQRLLTRLEMEGWVQCGEHGRWYRTGLPITGKRCWWRSLLR